MSAVTVISAYIGDLLLKFRKVSERTSCPANLVNPNLHGLEIAFDGL